MQLKAQRMIEGEHACEMNPDDREGKVMVKPTTFNTPVKVKASILCPTCDCEKVRHTDLHGNTWKVNLKLLVDIVLWWIDVFFLKCMFASDPDL